jgi:PD-(D/E)XK nuclease superfamily
MPRRKVDAQNSSVALHIGPSFAAASDTVVLPWLEAVGLNALEQNEPVAVVTPYPSDAIFLRAKLLERGISLLGVKFLTPPLLRELLLADGGSVPLREHLRLLMAVSAESIATEHADDVDLVAIAKSVARSPDNLLRVFDQISVAGWNLEQIGPPAVREIVTKFQKLVRQCDFTLVHEADRACLESAGAQPKRFNALLLTGFSAAHWSLLPLLQSAVFSAQRATVILEYPREQTRAGDEGWIGTWEEIFGAAKPIAEAGERKRPFAELIQPEPAANALAHPHFLVGLNTTEQARAIYAMALKFLSEKSCTRLGILFPGSGALPRLVSESLSRFGIPHHDRIGRLTPGELEEPAWNNWIHLQENHQLKPLLRFLETHSAPLGKLSIHHVRDRLRAIYREILLDDVAVLREYCAQRADRSDLAQIGKILGSIKFLPPKATLADFVADTKKIFAALKWEMRRATLEQFARNWSDALSLEFSRAIYLRWLAEALDSFSISRAVNANHVYSRVHLLTYAEAEIQEWSHLILAGMNQGEWPPAEHESGFLPDNQIAALNQRATRPGKQGEGHVALSKGKTFLLGSQNERQIAIRQFAAAVESAEHGLAITASLLQETAPERIWNPSELFSQIYFAAHRIPLSQEMLSILSEKTSAWLTMQSLYEQPVAANGEIEQTRIAYGARRRADVPFGEYEFALRRPIDRQITLRATEWNRVVKSPALIWMKTYLGLENEEPDLNQWSAATGSWVHDWLARIASVEEQNAFVDFPDGDEIRDRLARAAHAFHESVVDLCAAANRPLPDWWSSGWSNAFALADFLASKLSEMKGWPQLSAEWDLEAQSLTLADGNKLRVRGRIDLVLAQTRPANSKLAGGPLWIIDYKTGNQKPLSVSARTPDARVAKLRQKLVRGDAIQLGFYGLAARELGAKDVQLSILSLRTDLDKPQLVLDDLAQRAEFWSELHRMQETGVFGLRGLIRSDFAFHADYPLAILPIDKEFLDEKWVLTHPAFADEEDDRS